MKAEVIRGHRTKEQIERDISLWKSIRVGSRNGAQRARAAKRLESLNAEMKALAAALLAAITQETKS